MFGIANYLDKVKKNIGWRKRNHHNSTSIKSAVDMAKIIVGKNTYGCLSVFNPNPNYWVKIGSFCSIAPEVIFIPGSDHNLTNLSTYPFRVMVMGEQYEAISKGDIIIDDDVWIGCRATILSGVHIGQGAAVAAGAVVTKDVPPYSVVGGVPAKVIKYRFEQPVIDYMLTLDYSALTEELIRGHVDDLYTEIDGMELEEVKKLFSWFPKRGAE